MKKTGIFILSFFVFSSVFAQDMMEKRYFENHPELGGDVLIKSSSIKVEKDEIFKTFEIESSEENAYYMDVWIEAPLTKEGYPEYKVAVNGVLSEFTFKPQTDGWHSLPLTDAKKSVTAITLKKGKNSISIIGKRPEVPSIEFIKLSSNISKTGISDTNYKKFVESINQNTLKTTNNTDAVQASSSSLSGTAEEIYDYYLNIPVKYTTYKTYCFSPGENVNIKTSSSFPVVIEFFSMFNPGSYSRRAVSTTVGTNSVGNLNVTIPGSGPINLTGTYFLLLRSLNPSDIGVVLLSINNGAYSKCIVTYSPQFAVTGGYSTPANFYTCKIKNGGDTWLFLADNSGCIRAFNDDGGTKSDGYSWGSASRITTNLTDISYGLVFTHSYSLNFECDLYMGLISPATQHHPILTWDSYQHDYPKLPSDNSFLSGFGGEYNCVAWSVGITDPTFVPFYFNLEHWDIFYETYGYTRDGATANNAAIALWVNGGNVMHASVRKNSKNLNPHGFEWESKLGSGWNRIMHTRDALVNDGTCANCYGSIGHYYRPMDGTVNYSLPVSPKILESSFSTPELNRIATLKNHIPVAVLSDFDTKYLAWKKTWDRPETAIHSNPFMYARSHEYENLLEYCMKYGKAIWPLVFDKLVQRDIFVISLLRDLTYDGNPNFGAEITHFVTGKIPTLYSIQVDYCRELLAKEEANMLKSILDVSASKEKPFEVTVIVANSREMQLSLHSEKDEKALVKIYNFLGGIVFEASYNISKGNQTLVINTSNFKKGLYIVQIIIEGESISKTISI